MPVTERYLASSWPCVTDSRGLTVSKRIKGDEYCVYAPTKYEQVKLVSDAVESERDRLTRVHLCACGLASSVVYGGYGWDLRLDGREFN